MFCKYIRYIYMTTNLRQRKTQIIHIFIFIIYIGYYITMFIVYTCHMLI